MVRNIGSVQSLRDHLPSRHAASPPTRLDSEQPFGYRHMSSTSRHDRHVEPAHFDDQPTLSRFSAELRALEAQNEQRLKGATLACFDDEERVERGVFERAYANMNQTRQRLAEKEMLGLGYGKPGSAWEKEHDPLLYKMAEDCSPNELQSLSMKLAVANEHVSFPHVDTFNAAKYTKPFCDFLTDNPTVFHAVDAVKKQLKDAGFKELSERDSWDIEASGSYFVERNGSSLIAFTVGAKYEPGNGAAMLAGHVDALTAKLKPVSKVPNKAGYLQLGVAPYAGALNSTWWDRDLGIGGRVLVKEGDRIVSKLVKLDWPIARIPTLAPHFGAAANGPFNQETQMVPIIGLDQGEEEAASAEPESFSKPSFIGSTSRSTSTFTSTQPPALVREIATALGLKESEHSQIMNWELELFDVQPAAVGGINKDLIFAGRIDDKLCSWSAIQALLESTRTHTAHSGTIQLTALFDDEEIGSLLRQGARGNFLPSTLTRAVSSLAPTPTPADLLPRTYANSFLVSSDVIHAVNPNFLSAYLPAHAPHLNTGLVVSADSNGHMTTDSVSTAVLARCAAKVGAQLQVFQIRNDSRSGGTVGPMLSSAMGVRAVDAGMPQLSMHSIRATTGSLDPGLGVLAFTGFLNGFEAVDGEFRRGEAV